LRAVERITGRANAYLSQLERGVIKSPDPLLLLELADLYRINFALLAGWAGLARSEKAGEVDPAEFDDQTLKRMLRLIKRLTPHQRTQMLAVMEDVLKEPPREKSSRS
jgi:transcriptional regulator with XRE-family HTH domain